MTYKCLECGHIFEEGEEAVWEEKHGFLEPPYEKTSGCPMCGGSFEETEQCKICGSHHLWEELNGGVCYECFDEYKNDLEMCHRIGAKSLESVKVNCLFAFIFDEKDIERILYEELKRRHKYMKNIAEKEFEGFAKSDISWFCENLVEEVRKDENSKKQS
jgi:hypothetical protein